ncbi:hypothetical protein ACMGE7_09835 [Macrococcus equi]|uniref:hypothetical protein n=1 Tax=Macrococcus equi TaxID=3395462 RepID=UPI0039BEAAD2
MNKTYVLTAKILLTIYIIISFIIFIQNDTDIEYVIGNIAFVNLLILVINYIGSKWFKE